MKSKKLVSLILSVLLILATVPGTAFAEEAKTAIGGTLKLQGTCYIGEPLCADYTEVQPQGLTDEDFTFRWERYVEIEGEEEPLPLLLGTEKTYIPVDTDEGQVLFLTITAKEESPFAGELTAYNEKPIQFKPAEEEFTPAQDTGLFDGLTAQEEAVMAEDNAAPELAAEQLQAEPEATALAPAEADAGLFAPEGSAPADSSFTEPQEMPEEAAGTVEEQAGIPVPEGQEEAASVPEESAEEEKAPVAVSMQDLPAEEGAEETASEEENTEETPDQEAETAGTEEPEATEEETDLEKAAAGTEEAAVGESDDSELFDDDLSELGDDWVGDDEFEEGEEEYAGSFSLSTTAISFPDAESGYSVDTMQPQEFTVTNTGSTTLHMFMDTTSVLEYFDISIPAGANIDDLTIDPGQSMTFSVLPMEGLTPGTYDDNIYVDAGEVAEYMTIAVTFTVGGSSSAATLESITPPAAVTGLANGISVEELIARLPATVHIGTSMGDMDALVEWDYEDLDYDPADGESQTFDVYGLVTLPSEVSNPNEIDDVVTVSVTVNAAGSGGGTGAGYIATADKNAIYGVDPTGAYTTETRITFTAHGDGMDNLSPAVGDTRFIPVSWMVLESRNFDGEPFEASFRIAKAGGFTLTVTFNEQQYTSDGWVNTGVQDVKDVDFNVTDATNPLTITPGANAAVLLTPAATTRNPVATGDDTPIGAFVAILVVAVACIGGIIVYKKKRK